jgi:hypothetical protein
MSCLLSKTSLQWLVEPYLVHANEGNCQPQISEQDGVPQIV